MTEPDRPTLAHGTLRGVLARRMSNLGEAMAESHSPGEQAIVAAGLFTLERCVSVLDRMENLVEEQRASVRRGREIMEMFPPLLGKLGELLDVELANAKNRLGKRARGDVAREE